MSSKITTYTKKRMNPLKPNLDDISIVDIAHALSLLSRGNGQIKYFFSVAQHSINSYKEALARGYSKKVQLAALIHDASEAYLSDITRPVKRELKEYQVIEKNLQDLIYQKYIIDGLSDEDLAEVLDVDNAILVYELDKLLDTQVESVSVLLIEPDLRFKDMREVKEEFLNIFNQLISEL